MHRLMVNSIMLHSPRWLSTSFFRRGRAISRRSCTSPLPLMVERKYYFKSHKSMKGISKASRRLRSHKDLCEETGHSHILWWKERMQMCKKPSTVQLVKRLDYSNILGLDVNLKNGSLKEGTLNMEILQFKSRFPREVLLCRVGDFYEAIGFDACVLVEHAGLNPFGGLRSDSIPRAGCPVVNLRQTLDDLTRSGYSVCIVEELQGPTQARSRKGRFISGHAYPGSPYVFGLAGGDHDVDFPEPMPVVGISRSAKGYCMISVLETMKTFSAEDGLTEEAIVTKLRTCRYHHLFLHMSLRHNVSGTSRWGNLVKGGFYGENVMENPLNGLMEILLKNFYASCQKILGPHKHFICLKVREIYGIDDEATFRNVTISSERRPQPLYLGTATEIGVITTEGIPCLLKMLLPSNYAGLPVLYIRDLLLNPPAYEIALAIQEACKLMSSVTCSIPDFTCISGAKLVKLLESKEANHIEFCRIKNVVDEVLHMSRNSELSKILHVLLAPTWAATGLQVEYEMMVHECAWVSHRIDEIISQSDEKGQEISSFEFIPQEFFQDMESSWKGRVKRIHAMEAFEEVDKAAEVLSIAIKEDFLPIVLRVKSVISSLGGPKGETCYARDHEAVWFKGKRFIPAVWANTPGEEEIKQLKPATDSKGKKVGEEWYTTNKVENALSRYHEACEKATNKVLELLRGLSAELQNKINVLVFSSMLLVVAKALAGHVSEGRRREWAFPCLVEFIKNKDKNAIESINCMELRGLSPYWFDASQGTAIKNTVEMQSLFLLTGPNGGGKSSLLRSICAAALLGICGLMVPADLAVIPHFDSIMLHMKAYDSPADGKSSFQIEMSEIRSIVMAASSKSLVLVDEICRGTETAKGTCIAGSIIENLDHIGCLGIVSTHLHGIFDLPLVTKNVVYKAMGSQILDGVVRPTWKLIDGVCKESLAFETAQREGLPEIIIDRARELYISVNAIDTTAVDVNRVNPMFHVKDLSKVGEFSLSGTLQVLQDEVENAIKGICQERLTELYKKNTSDLLELKCIAIGGRELPPPSTVGASCIYVLFRADNKIYVGQTDDLAGRVRAHRSKEGMQNATFIYIVVPGKSIASQLETLLIHQLPRQGFKLVNKADGKHRNFGTSNLTLESLSLHP